tara:strand:- start:354 stop:989 length:636 start_codon:yes stop_codon:yes gene_type:complete
MNTLILKNLKNISINFFFLLYLISFLYSNEKFLLSDSLDWKQIFNVRNIKISTVDLDSSSYCKAIKSYNFSPEEVKTILDDKFNYINIFERINYVKMLSENTVHIKLSLPFPFSGRDYIVNYNYIKTKNFDYYIYKATKEFNLRKEKGYVRLINAYGIWKIEPDGYRKTKLTHIWNGELRGNFPKMALNFAWIAQGTELLESIEKALELRN